MREKELLGWLEIIRRRKFLIIGFTLMCTLGAYLALISKPQKYNASAILQYVDRFPAGNALEGMNGGMLASMAGVNIHQKVSEIKNAKNLFEKTVGEINNRGEFKRKLAIGEVSNGLTIEIANEAGKIIKLNYYHTDPAVALSVLGHFIQILKEEDRREYEEIIESAVEYIESQIEQVEKKLSQQQREISGIYGKLFVSEGAEKSGEATTPEELLASLNNLNRKNERLQSELSRYGDMSGMIGSLNSLKEQIAKLEAQLVVEQGMYAGQNPRIIRLKNQIDELKGKKDELDKNGNISLEDYEILLNESRVTSMRIIELEETLKSLGINASAGSEGEKDRQHEKLDVYEKLAMTVDFNKDLLKNLRRYREEYKILKYTKAESIKVLWPPEKPTVAKAPPIAGRVLVMLIASLIGGVFLAGILENLDDRLIKQDELEEITGKPVLGAIPLSVEVGGQNGAMDPAGELYRFYQSLVINIKMMNVDREKYRFFVTSCLPQEGKTTVVFHLAHLFSMEGPTIVIDADLNKPNLHNVFKAPNGKGLTDVVIGEAALEETVVKISDNLSFLSAGTKAPDVYRILNSREFNRTLDAVGAGYDNLIVDCSPLEYFSDALLVSRSVSDCLIVVGQNDCRRNEIVRTFKKIERAGINVSGLIVNKAPLAKAPYYYSYGGYFPRSKKSNYNGEM